jgi:hypothetical protein
MEDLKAEPLPEWVVKKILNKVENKKLAEEALKYVYITKKPNGDLEVSENFKDTDKHALWFMVLACVNYARRLLRGEDIDDI